FSVSGRRVVRVAREPGADLLRIPASEADSSPRWHAKEAGRHSCCCLETSPPVAASSDMRNKKALFMQWFETQLTADPAFQRQVEETLNEMRLEQDLVALREARGV